MNKVKSLFVSHLRVYLMSVLKRISMRPQLFMHFPPFSTALPTSSFIDIFPARHFFIFYAFCTRICNEH